jgi:hypothetical protein
MEVSLQQGYCTAESYFSIMSRSDFGSGAKRISSGETASGPFFCLTALTATTLGAATDWSDLGGGTAAGLAIPAAGSIRGWFNSVQVSSGDLIAYVR